ncbi:MAG: hypothetical protein EZS28_031366 [Streblomastix strix]|uniref:Uncharacterized protein n=1 Tax=Streblomastix strix TaxID=222440 RepID=A0A5J4URU5_9EUKA|nr:MAG: hypothetical protein EZS28_031366 [Streblomastix strix]
MMHNADWGYPGTGQDIYDNYRIGCGVSKRKMSNGSVKYIAKSINTVNMIGTSTTGNINLTYINDPLDVVFLKFIEWKFKDTENIKKKEDDIKKKKKSKIEQERETYINQDFENRQLSIIVSTPKKYDQNASSNTSEEQKNKDDTQICIATNEIFVYRTIDAEATGTLKSQLTTDLNTLSESQSINSLTTNPTIAESYAEGIAVSNSRLDPQSDDVINTEVTELLDTSGFGSR